MFQLSLNLWQSILVLLDFHKWWYHPIQQYNIVLDIAQTLLRRSSGISLVEFTSSWTGRFIVGQVLKQVFCSSSKTKDGITPIGFLPIHTGNVLLNFGLDIQNQTNIRVRKPKKIIYGHQAVKINSFCLWPQTTCTWNLKLKFQRKLELHSRNNATYRVQIRNNPIWLLGGHLKVTSLKINRVLPIHTYNVPLKFGLYNQS